MDIFSIERMTAFVHGLSCNQNISGPVKTTRPQGQRHVTYYAGDNKARRIDLLNRSNHMILQTQKATLHHHIQAPIIRIMRFGFLALQYFI